MVPKFEDELAEAAALTTVSNEKKLSEKLFHTWVGTASLFQLTNSSYIGHFDREESTDFTHHSGKIEHSYN